MQRVGTVYIISNDNNNVIYIGVTSDLYARILEHRNKVHKNSFSARYNLSKLVYYENFGSIEEAIDREKKLKASTRVRKDKLIGEFNPFWKDLFNTLSS